MNLFRHSDYKQVLHEMIRENQGVYGYKSQLAQAAGCQNSFFSQVLNSHVHLTPEHAVGLADYWKLGAEEKDYFVELVNLARASTKALKGYLKAKLERIRREIEAGKMRHTENEVGEEWIPLYYSSWHYVAIHFVVSIPEYRSASAIARRLQIPETQVESYLKELEKMKLVQRKGERWEITANHVTTPKNSPYGSMYHAQWLQKALIDTFANRRESIHFTGVYGMSREDIERLRAMMFQLIEKSGKIIQDSKEEELICMSLDLFAV